MAVFGYGITTNPQNKVSSCFREYILQPWTTPNSPLDRCIHTDFGNIVDKGRYRRDCIIADDVAIDGNGTPDPQKKVSSRYRTYILQTPTMYLPPNRCIHTDFGNIAHEGRYRRDFAIVDDIAIDVGVTKINKTR
jgi:hypothetical protein